MVSIWRTKDFSYQAEARTQVEAHASIHTLEIPPDCCVVIYWSCILKAKCIAQEAQDEIMLNRVSPSTFFFPPFFVGVVIFWSFRPTKIAPFRQQRRFRTICVDFGAVRAIVVGNAELNGTTDTAGNFAAAKLGLAGWQGLDVSTACPSRHRRNDQGGYNGRDQRC